jgi:hypothetical protein
MEYGRHDWCRQELECIRFELQRLNHLKDYVPPMQFFRNELQCIDDLQEGLLRRDEPTLDELQEIYWLAADLKWHNEHTAYMNKLTSISAQAGTVCRVMGGIKSSYMGDGYPID